MDKRIAGLLGAAAALTTVTGAHAAVPAPANQPASVTTYRDLLDPVPNAVAALKADDARLAEKTAAEASGDQVAQLVFEHHHHHHHHIVPRPFRRLIRRHHHHHHHHHY
jgi:hypothetical protein